LTGWNPLMSCTMIRRSALIEIGGLDEGLSATEDLDLSMRLAQRTDFAGTAEVLVVRHERHGEQLSRNPELLARDAAVLDGKWRSAITVSSGRVAYRQWRLWLVMNAERCRATRVAEVGAGERLEGARRAGRLCRLLPWSAPHVADALALAVVGPKAYRRAHPYVAWYWYRGRKALGLRTTSDHHG
jgi:cellulose synthase/poly-beta-1,6-N-acetylglucosamine synthase-like glycosyltransferase